MGEEKEKIKAKGVEKKNNDAGGKPTGGGKKDDGIATILLKLDLHCEGCAKKVKRSVRQFEGVEDVKSDYSTGKLTVKGNVDPLWLRETVEIKTKKKVALLSAQHKFDGDSVEKKSDEKIEKKAEENTAEDKKPKKTQFNREVIRVHCDGSAQKVKRFIIKELLTPYLKDKLKRNVHVVPPKKHDGSGGRGNNKEKDGSSGGGGGGGSSKDKYVESTAAQSKKIESKEQKAEVMNKMKYYHGGYSNIPNTYYTMPPMYNQNYSNQDYGLTMHDHGYYGHSAGYVPSPPPYFTPRDHGYGHTVYVSPRHLATPHNHSHGYGYGHGHDIGYVPPPYTAPQLFSDENPNGCSVM
ncbi:hypothetical protein HAX54_034548 [Datura stramonium]|uniref:HMA domain-containing protein n=1 Tax=Datura stramonium TaxID=4076 RepID=A0ABS8VHA2_DATST|nr:hypothetical protein [Datura stramonium]